MWAACGFAFAADDDRTDVLNALEGISELLGLPLTDLDRESFEPWDIAMMESVSDLTLREFMDTYDASVIEEAGADADYWDTALDRPGKLLLLLEAVPGWRGVLDLRDTPDNLGRALMYDYTADHGD